MKLESIIKIINDKLEVDIYLKTRKRNVVYARYIYFKISKELGYSLESIGNKVKMKHSNVLHGLKQYDSLIHYQDFIKMAKLVKDELND